MRYEVRSNNHTNHVFDTLQYRAVASYSNRGAALRHAERLNARPPAPRPRRRYA